MTREDIIRLAHEAGLGDSFDDGDSVWLCDGFYQDELERFAALVAAAERERMDLNSIHSCHAECDNPFCVRVREAVAHEREECAKLCEEIARENEAECDIDWVTGNMECADYIRARGET
jgi:hypothetical protein